MRITTLSCLLVLSCVLAQGQTGRDLSTDRSVLAGTSWRLVSMGPTGAETNVIAGTNVTLRFGDEGRASGSTGCNSFSGTYDVSGDRISFGRLASTRRACLDQNANQQEQRYLSALEAASRFRLASDRLTINYNGRRNALNFMSDSPANGPQPADNDPVSALSAYYNAINARNYEQAYGVWETAPSAYDSFVRGFADTQRVRLLIEPPARVEGAAGSLYAHVPTIVVTETRTGRERFFAGCYVMRKSNQPGARWRIYRATIAQRSASVALTNPISQTCAR